ERRIEISTEPLRHIGNPANLRIAIRRVGHVAVEHDDSALLDYTNAGDETEQRGLAGAVRPDHSDHLAGGDIQGDIVKRKRFAITMGNAFDLGYDVSRHGKALRRGFAATKSQNRSERTPCRELQS